MELWVRGQHNGALIKSSGLYFRASDREFPNGDKTKWVICDYSSDEVIACYKTMERCIEILDEIQKLVLGGDKTLVAIKGLMEEDTYENVMRELDKNKFAMIGLLQDSNIQAVSLNTTVVYQMPEK